MRVLISQLIELFESDGNCLHGKLRNDFGVFRPEGLERYFKQSALRPGQTCKTPAADRAAATVGILVSFKAFENVETVGKARLGRRGGRCPRADTAAADEQQQGFVVDSALEFSQEIRVGFHAGVGLPFDFDGIRDAADPVQFGAAANIDEPRTGGALQNFPRLARRQRTFEGELLVAAALCGDLENL